MPEGPTVHRLARDLNDWLGGQKLAVSSPQGRFAEEANVIDGRRLTACEAWGKHLFYHFSGSQVIHVHLGMYGQVRKHANPPPQPRGAVRLRLTGKQFTVDLNGPNQCELIDASAEREVIARIGPDPLRDDADPALARQRILASRTPIGQLLMDQNVIGGIGNIYRCELLWMMRIHPRTPGRLLKGREFGWLWKRTKALMELAVREGKIITREETVKRKPPIKLTRHERFNIYNRPTCPRCGEAIERFMMAGRKVYACAACQVTRDS